MVTGIGTVVILGVAVHQGVRYVLAINDRERKKRREHLIQHVIKHHQQAMAEVTDDIAGLLTGCRPTSPRPRGTKSDSPRSGQSWTPFSWPS